MCESGIVIVFNVKLFVLGPAIRILDKKNIAQKEKVKIYW